MSGSVCVCVRACERDNTCRNNVNILLQMLNGYRLLFDRIKNPNQMTYTMKMA